MTEQQRDRWRAGTTIALIGIVFTMMVQLGGGIWWASAINSRVQTVETGQTMHAGRLSQLEGSQTAISIMAGRLDERLLAQQETLAEIKALLQQMSRPPR